MTNQLFDVLKDTWGATARLANDLAMDIGSRRISVMDIASAVLITLIIYLTARLVHRLLMRIIGQSNRLDLSQKTLLQKLAGIGVVAISIMLGVDLLGIDLTALAVFSGALGLAVGFGLQKTLGNLLAGLILLMDKSVKPGDVIAVGNTFGAINKIGIRAVSVITRDGKEHLIPNELLMTKPVENWSFSSRNVRVRIPVSVSGNADIRIAQALMVEAARSCPRVLEDPAPQVRLLGFGDGSAEHEIRVWIADPEQGVGNVRSEILNRLWVLFKENGIALAVAERNIHVRSGGAQPSHVAE